VHTHFSRANAEPVGSDVVGHVGSHTMTAAPHFGGARCLVFFNSCRVVRSAGIDGIGGGVEGGQDQHRYLAHVSYTQFF
jgi:hypothetical protein